MLLSFDFGRFVFNCLVVFIFDIVIIQYYLILFLFILLGYDPKLLSPHLRNLFRSIDHLECIVSEDGLLYHITGYVSLLGENIKLAKVLFSFINHF